MRMRRKKNLESRLKECEKVCLGMIPFTEIPEEVELKEGEIKLAEALDFGEIFGNDNPVRIEIGCGKGTFAQRIAEENPDINFIAVEIAANVLVTAMERTLSKGTQNLRYLTGDAKGLGEIVKESSIDAIYLNFSCPFPKKRTIKKRLTHEGFLSVYKKILKNGGKIYQKTDKAEFFDYSLESFADNGWKISNVTRDLHNSEIKGNIITEYEQKFLDQGLPINYLEAENIK